MTNTPSLSAKLLAEFVGTLTLIAAGVGSILVASSGGGIIAVAFAHGLAIAVMVTAIGHVSGGHLNPAVTLSMVATGQQRLNEALWYWAAQLAGGTAGALLIDWLFDGFGDVKTGVPQLIAEIGPWRGVAIEALLTFFLVWVVFAVAVDRRGAFAGVAGLPIGLTITMDILMGGPLTGAAMNPARSFGPALVGNQWNDAWVYWVGPAIGAVIAGILYARIVQTRSGD